MIEIILPAYTNAMIIFMFSDDMRVLYRLTAGGEVR